jgi:DNA-binding MarR family transcriptional regulator
VASSADRRGIQVSITAAGRKIVRRAEDQFEEHIASLVARLTDAERAGLSALASRIVVQDARNNGIEPTRDRREQGE